MTGTFSSRRLRRFLPRSGTQLAKLQEELETQLRETAADEGDSTEESGDDVLDIGDSVDEDSTRSSMGDEDDELEEMEDDEEDDPIVGNGFVEEVAEELEGSRTRRGRRYDGGGHL
jgi:hypothetical protein